MKYGEILFIVSSLNVVFSSLLNTKDFVCIIRISFLLILFAVDEMECCSNKQDVINCSMNCKKKIFKVKYLWRTSCFHCSKIARTAHVVHLGQLTRAERFCKEENLAHCKASQ